MSMDTILYEVKEGIATIILNRPDKLNAITFEMLDEIMNSLDEAAVSDNVRVVVIKGSGERAFSAGDDLKGMGLSSRKIPSDRFSQLNEGHPRLLKAIRSLMKPVIASVHGYCLGAACEAALACDLIIAAEDARLGLPYVQRGLGSGTWIVPMTVGYHKACELLFFGDWVSGKEAERIGMINKAVPADQLDATVGEWAARLAKGATAAIAHMKRSMNYSPMIDLEVGLNFQSLSTLNISDTEDAKEGRQSFIEKREPRYKGR